MNSELRTDTIGYRSKPFNAKRTIENNNKLYKVQIKMENGSTLEARPH